MRSRATSCGRLTMRFAVSSSSHSTASAGASGSSKAVARNARRGRPLRSWADSISSRKWHRRCPPMATSTPMGRRRSCFNRQAPEGRRPRQQFQRHGQSAGHRYHDRADHTAGDQTLFASVDLGKRQHCPGGVGLTTALAVFRAGWVVVGSLPTSDGTIATAEAGCLIVLNNNGRSSRRFPAPPSTVPGT